MIESVERLGPFALLPISLAEVVPSPRIIRLELNELAIGFRALLVGEACWP
jgi:hypothetical protein